MENDNNSNYKDNVYSSVVPAGKKRTYFFDVRETRGNDYFITLTESTRRQDGNGYNRHKLFLYKEDFNKFLESLQETIDYVKENLMPEFDYEKYANDEYYEGEEGIEDKPEIDSSEDDSLGSDIDTDFDIGEDLSW